MSELAAIEHDDPAEGFADEPDAGVGLDPFDPGFGEHLGAAIAEQVEAGVSAALGLAQPEPEPDGYDEPPAELTAEEEAQAVATLDRVFDDLAAEVSGPFDRREAVEEAALIFAERVEADPAADTPQVAEEALRLGAERAAATRWGEGIVDDLVAAELIRVGNVDPDRVRAVAEELVEPLLDQGWEVGGAVQYAVRAAASAVAGGGWRPMQSPTQLARYYAAAGRAVNKMETPPAGPARPEARPPGHPESARTLAEKYSALIRAERGL
jgi:hypothetical protein